jgi:hypothetical protein
MGDHYGILLAEFVFCVFSVVLAFVLVLGKTKAAAPKVNCSGLGDLALASLVLSVGRSLKNGSYVLILKALCLPGFKYLSSAKGDGADEPPTLMEPCTRGGTLLEGELCLYGLFFTHTNLSQRRQVTSVYNPYNPWVSVQNHL